MASRRKTGSVGITPVAPRHWLLRASLLLMITASVVLVVMGRQGNPTVAQWRTQAMDVVTPVLAAAASPMEALSGIGEWFGEMADLRAQNLALKNENRKLLEWQAAAKSLEAENNALRQIVKAAPAGKKHYITARIVSDLGGPYVQAALLAAGVDHGVAKNQAVVNERGLIGRVVETGMTSSRVLLLGDVNSRVPVMMETTREKGMLAGSSSGVPRLTYLPVDSSVAAGDRIVTSGDGGMFPQGIPVGVVQAVDKDGASVQLFADPARAEFVTIIDYRM